MNHSPAQIIRQFLQDASLIDESASWQSFVSFMPPEPNEALCFYDIAGVPNGRLHRTGEKIEHDGVQILLRGRDYTDAWVKSHAIATYLDIQRNVTVEMDSDNSYLVYNISRPGSILAVGIDPQDDKRRHNFSINLQVSLYKGAFADLPSGSVSVSTVSNGVGSGSPEGVVAASPGSSYLDTDNDSFWMKKTGSGNTGWIQLLA